jgi:hypothetical protein
MVLLGMVEPLTCEQAGSIGSGMTCSRCLLEQPSIISNCHEKKESVSLEEQQNWAKMFESGKCELVEVWC